VNTAGFITNAIAFACQQFNDLIVIIPKPFSLGHYIKWAFDVVVYVSPWESQLALLGLRYYTLHPQSKWSVSDSELGLIADRLSVSAKRFVVLPIVRTKPPYPRTGGWHWLNG
tara:strand:- start:3 stop:341 length:339 start_codon:yes stop_codon:yes gene_type:complete